MDFFIQKTEFLQGLNFVRGAVEKRATIPILSHFLLEADGLELRITATDLEITARATCQGRVRTKGAAVVPGQRFLEIVRSAESGEIRCRSLENHSVQITYGRSSFKLVGLPIHIWRDGEIVEVSANELTAKSTRLHTSST